MQLSSVSHTSKETFLGSFCAYRFFKQLIVFSHLLNTVNNTAMSFILCVFICLIWSRSTQNLQLLHEQFQTDMAQITLLYVIAIAYIDIHHYSYRFLTGSRLEVLSNCPIFGSPNFYYLSYR